MLWKKQKLRDQPKGRSNIWFSLFATLLTTSLALIMIPYENFVTNVADIFTFPYERFRIDPYPEESLSTLLKDARPLGRCQEDTPENPKIAKPSPETEKAGEIEVLYLFLLDISGSTKSQEKITTPIWLSGTIDRIQAYMRDDIFNSIKRNKVPVFDLARVRLGDLLIRIGPKDAATSLSNEKFALWSLGSHPERLFPSAEEKKEVPLEKDAIRGALKALEEKTDNNDRTTDFVSVVEEFEDNYSDYLPQNPELPRKDRVVMITIFSDFIHDVPNRESEIEKEWSVLEERIRYHSHANVVVNLIVLTGSGQVEKLRLATHRQINQPYERHFPLSKLSSEAIAEEVQDHLLYPPMCSQQPIKFYYEGQRFISDFTFRIDKGVKQENKHFDLTIVIPEETDQQSVSLRWSLLTAEDHEGKRSTKEIGWLSSNREILSKNKLELNERVHLVPLDHPSHLGGKTVSAQFISSALRRVHHVDIQFIKVMPAWYARIIIVFHVILAVLFLVLSVQGIRILFNKWRERKERMVVPDKGPTKIKFKDLEGSIWGSSMDRLIFEPDRHYLRSPLDRSKPKESGSYQIIRHDGKTLLRLFGSSEGAVHNQPVPTDWEIIYWDKHKLDLVQPSGQVIHYQRHRGPTEGDGSVDKP
ncbi:hypothetical protein [Candidatus Thiosymbion oneisti]|uniref:hypothetical protein n=1 Tax=Candidatus Thiosymbion oneisti TaxID=589554 RepID=UPI000B7E0F36|nr:hypothetical protein [Candidatus Thiosymbion oneisti]